MTQTLFEALTENGKEIWIKAFGTPKLKHHQNIELQGQITLQEAETEMVKVPNFDRSEIND